MPLNSSHKRPVTILAHGILLIALLASSASVAKELHECIIKKSLVALSAGVDTKEVRDCLDARFTAVLGGEAEPLFVPTNGDVGKMFIETAQFNALVLPQGVASTNDNQIAIVLTAVRGGTNEHKTKLESSEGIEEVSVRAAMTSASGILKAQELGEKTAIDVLSGYQFNGLSNRKDGTMQHFHLVRINC